MASATTDKLISIYVAMRDAISIKEKAFKKEKGDIKEKMGVIEKELFKRLEADGLDSLKSDSGTAFKSTKQFVGVENFDEFMKFLIKSVIDTAVSGPNPLGGTQAVIDHVLQNASLQFLNKVVNKAAVLEYMEENNDKLPPGIKYSSEIVIQVRK